MQAHGTVTVEWLREAGFDDEEVLHAILAHNSDNGSTRRHDHGPGHVRVPTASPGWSPRRH